MQMIKPAVVKTKLATPRPPRQTLRRERLTRRLQESANTERSFNWQSIVYPCLNALLAIDDPVLFALDDVHLLSPTAETHQILARIIDYAPPCLHLILSTRSPLTWKELRGWRMRGQLLEIGYADLALNNMVLIKPSSHRELLARLGLTEEQSVYLGEIGHTGEQDDAIILSVRV
jgi:ATP/maltotriose-dependent transcriptional regulator MalT